MHSMLPILMHLNPSPSSIPDQFISSLIDKFGMNASLELSLEEGVVSQFFMPHLVSLT